MTNLWFSNKERFRAGKCTVINCFVIEFNVTQLGLRGVHANCPPEICPLPKALFQKLFSKCPPNLTALPKNCPHPKTLFQKPSSKCPLCQMPSAIYSLPFALLQMPSTKRGNWQRAFDRGQSAEGKWQGVFDRGQLAEGKWQRAIG